MELRKESALLYPEAGLSVSEVAEFRASGVLFPIPVLSEMELGHYRAMILNHLKACNDGSNPRELGQTHLFYSWACKLAMHPRVLDSVEALLGPNLLVHSSTIFRKSPWTDHYVSWHQDGYSLQLDRPKQVTVWIAITESNEKNGCVQAIKSSHLRGMVKHDYTAVSPNNLLTSGLQAHFSIEKSKVLNMSLLGGEASIHDLYTIHGSSANRSANPRIGFVVRFVAAEARQRSPHHPVLLARGRPDGCHFEIQEPPQYKGFEQSMKAHIEFTQRLAAERAKMGRN